MSDPVTDRPEDSGRPEPAGPGARPFAAFLRRSPVFATVAVAHVLVCLHFSIVNRFFRQDDWCHPFRIDVAIMAASLAAVLVSWSWGNRRRLWALACVACALGGVHLAVAVGDQPMREGGPGRRAKWFRPFRECVEQGRLPEDEAVAPEWIFNDYHFTAGTGGDGNGPFGLTCGRAVSTDPLSGSRETYLLAGVDSTAGDGFRRKRLNLVLVLDISAAMSARFGSNCFDRLQRDIKGLMDDERIPGTLGIRKRDFQKMWGDPAWNRTLMSVAGKAASDIVGHLKDDDRLGIVLFNHRARLAKPFGPVGRSDVADIRRHLTEIRPYGGRNMYSGVREATDMLEGVAADSDPDEWENRILLVSRAMPEFSALDDPRAPDHALVRLCEANGGKRIYTTFIGAGLDGQTHLVERLAGIRGADYRPILSPDDFARRLDDEFDRMVTPLAFDVSLRLECAGASVGGIVGAPADGAPADGRVRIGTLFPAGKGGEGSRGRVVLARLDGAGGGVTAKWTASYEDRRGTARAFSREFRFDAPPPADAYDGAEVRKAVALARYAELLKSWIASERAAAAASEERSGGFEGKVAAFSAYFSAEIGLAGDNMMKRELDQVMDVLLSKGKGPRFIRDGR